MDQTLWSPFMSHRITRSGIFAAALVGLAVPARAHHSFGQFEMNKPLRLSGTLTEMHFINPHSHMEIAVVDDRVIDITYGLYNFERRIHVGMAKHPDRLKPSYAGHSTGTWEGNTLVVDTVGFAAGVLSPPTRSSEQMHIVERFTFDPQNFSLRRDYSVTDPVYLAAPYESYDIMYLSDVPYQKQPCKDMTPEFQQKK
jgi:hypothetical protein